MLLERDPDPVQKLFCKVLLEISSYILHLVHSSSRGDAKLDISCCHNPRNLSVVNLYDDDVRGGILDLSEEGFRFEIENCVALNVDRGAKGPDVLGGEEIVVILEKKKQRFVDVIRSLKACTNTLQQQPKNSNRNVNLALEAVLEFDNKDPGDIPLLDNIKKLIDNLKDAMRDNKRRNSRRSLRENTDYLGTLNHKIIKRLNYLEKELHELKQANSLKDCPTNDKNRTVQCLTRGSSGRDEKPDEARKRSLMKGFNISDNMSDLVSEKCDKCNATRIYRKVLKTNMTEVKKTMSSDQTSNVRLKSDNIFLLDDSYVSKDDRKYEHKTKTSTAEMSNELSDTNFISHRAKDWARITRGLEFSSPPHNDIFHPSKVW
ncbi:hypothetical protein HW555_013770 [Spodoptera exigua]|uniref:Uncharacterized protein n=1 Tax=Spodoptera exigua TaxID=7107 RepID=A0A835G294_SPOEX|nr:hypothetical protein HW555_013770 [Spodoptera exigua]